MNETLLRPSALLSGSGWLAPSHYYRKALSSMLVVLAHEPDSGLIHYGIADVLQKDESDVVLEFLDFYRSGDKKKENKLSNIIFGSKFTKYETLGKLDYGHV